MCHCASENLRGGVRGMTILRDDCRGQRNLLPDQVTVSLSSADKPATPSRPEAEIYRDFLSFSPMIFPDSDCPAPFSYHPTIMLTDSDTTACTGLLAEWVLVVQSI